mgnify:CR=1 FL=1
MDNIIGMMWNYNEADVLEEVIRAALPHVDSLFIADDNSKDNSWEIIQSLKKMYPDKIEYIRNKRADPRDQGQRQSLLNEIRKRYKPENSWVQIIESDIMILDTNIREALKDFAQQDLGMSWQTLNAAREPGTWKEADTYPEWDKSITEIMPLAHWIEVMLYTFRPLPDLAYNLDTWKPWPQGFAKYSTGELTFGRRCLNAPLLAHYGYRGPTHMYLKNKHLDSHRKYTSWRFDSPEVVEETVYFFNGIWNNGLFPMSREGWINWRKG